LLHVAGNNLRPFFTQLFTHQPELIVIPLRLPVIEHILTWAWKIGLIEFVRSIRSDNEGLSFRI